jgi:uncharacterized delta-60 repeat protein
MRKHLGTDWAIAVVGQTLRVFVLTVAGILASSTLVTRVEATAGDLDPTFGTAGKVTTDFFDGDDDVFAVAIQPGGKIVVAGLAQISSEDSDFALARYNRDGSLDTSFGDDGKVTTDFFGFAEAAIAVALQPDGKIVAVGGTGFGFAFDFALARYNRDGSLDTSFGDGGKVTTDFFGGADQARAVAIQPGGKIVVAGLVRLSSEDFDFALARYNRDGSLDTSFGDGGKVTTDFFGFSDTASAVAIQPGGKIVVAGSAQVSSEDYDFALARYNRDGSLDTRFGDGGKVTTDFFAAVDNVTAVALQPGGRIVAAGGAFNISTGNDFALARYNRDGSLDTSFGDGGKVTTDFFGFGGVDSATAVALHTGGRIVAAGAAGGSSGILDFALARYNRDGSLDTSFGDSGKVTTDFFGGFDEATAVALQPGGRIVAAGFAVDGSTDSDFALARYVSK